LKQEKQEQLRDQVFNIEGLPQTIFDYLTVEDTCNLSLVSKTSQAQAIPDINQAPFATQDTSQSFSTQDITPDISQLPTQTPAASNDNLLLRLSSLDEKGLITVVWSYLRFEV
jgi:hypothetical protein